MRKDGIIRRVALSLAFAAVALCAGAENKLVQDMNFVIRFGYNIGGTAPVGMPASIRSLNEFKMQPNFTLSFEAQKDFWGRWGLLMGVRLEDKGMEVDATVKNYHTAMVKGGDRIEGYYTGDLVTEVDLGMFTIPVMATYKINEKLLVKLGPYVSYVTTRKFTGYAHDGYLRHINPTGDKINIGNTPDTRGDYDFSEDMRKFHWGIDAGIDWQIYRRWGAYADLQWGLNGVQKSSFKTIEQTLFPIYGTFGIIFKLNN